MTPLIGDGVEACRKAQDRIGALGARVLGDKVRYSPAVSTPYQADWAEVEAPRPNCAILYLHGGGYTAGTLEYARGFGGVISELTQCRTLCVGYRLAPEEPFPAALCDALDAYRLMLRDYDPARIALIGESAGGGLCYALCLRLREEGLPLPACIVAISPWTDLSLSLDAITRNASLDPTLDKESLALQARMYAGTALRDPLVSPLYADLHGLPPSMLYAGSHEILEDDARAMHAKLQSALCQSTLHVEEGAWHAYVLYGIYEARKALEEITCFIGDFIYEG